jgi:uncharacterized repeat protein (TIGR04076 family)
MSENPKMKVTVLKIPTPEEIWDEMPLTLKISGPCPYYTVGQEFIIDRVEKPEGFCNYAWNALFPYLLTIRWGGNFSEFFEEPGTMLACCPDASRPVSFLIERI